MGYKTSSEIRHQNLLVLLSRFRTLNEFSDFIGKPQALISQVKNGKGIGNELAREIEDKFNLENGWMDNEHREKLTEFHDAIDTIRQALSVLDLTEEEVSLIDEFRALDDTQRSMLLEVAKVHRKKI